MGARKTETQLRHSSGGTYFSQGARPCPVAAGSGAGAVERWESVLRRRLVVMSNVAA